MFNQKQNQEIITEQYTFLLQNLSDLIISYLFQGKLHQAHQLLEKGMQLIKEETGVSPQSRSSFLLHAGILQAKSIIYLGHKAATALATLSRARELAETIDDEKLLINIIDWTGQALYFQALNTHEDEADFQTSLQHFNDALDRRQQSNDAWGICESIFNIGRVHQNSGDNSQAYTHFAKALEIAEVQNHQILMAEILLHLGVCIQEMGKLEEARSSLMLGMTMREELNIRVDLPFTYMNMGDLEQVMTNMEQAELYYRKAAMLAQEMELPIPYIFALLSIGYLHLAREQPTRALASFETARHMATRHSVSYVLAVTSIAQTEARTRIS
ncbi:hypothetical protein KDH_21010 [Dictyobacter sp. S3.2.2.5]|uniref:MalT-like TPR region domain-containing protein n=1 Tax=Dictyobacter halimunensis TaxID=3026934 RepID=A0ABQ6FNH0_9CHLR|nr:hypothetical protein KDH_21010 [Dictyobacter sp. S3.2.2.5]